LKKPQRVFICKPLSLSVIGDVTEEIRSIDVAAIDKNNIRNSSYQLMNNHAFTLAKIIAIGVTNKAKKKPSKRLINFFLWNLNSAELSKAAAIIMYLIDMPSFFKAFVSVRGLNILGGDQFAKDNEMLIEVAKELDPE
jgi:hypothetical protein